METQDNQDNQAGASAVPRLEALLHRTLLRVCDLLEADVASVAMQDPDGRVTWRAMVGYRTQALGETPVGAHLVYRVLSSRQMEVVSAAGYDGEALRADFPLLAAEGVETGLGVPLAFEAQPLGALLIGWRRPYTLTPTEQRLVQAVADQVISTITLARLYEETGRQRNYLQSIIQHVPAGIVAFDLPDFRVREVNRFYLQFLDEPFRSGTVDLHGRHLGEFIPQVEESGVQSIFERVAASGEPFTINEFEYQGFSRGVTYWDWSLVPLRAGPQAATTGVLLLITESTEEVLARRRLGEALAAARAQASELETVIQQMVEGVAITDSTGNLIKINPAGVAMLGRGVITREPGVDYAERYQIYDPAGHLYRTSDLPTERARRGETVLDEDMLVRQPDGRERVISVSAAPLFNEAQEITGTVAVFHDVTKAREVERVKDEFLAIVSHELRTPLAAILGYTDLMLRGLSGPLTAKQRQNQQSIKNNATRLLGLINDLLDVSKLEARGVTLVAEPVLLQDLVPKAVAWVQVLAAARGVTVTHTLPADLPPIQGDVERLHQVLTNLLSNAIKFTPANGTVEVQAHLSAVQADAPTASAEPDDAPPASILVTVTDTGVGLRSDQLVRIWDRFYQADSTSSRRYGGTGLGLAIVKNLIELHGGQVWATSAGTGRGSTFHFRLPLAPAEAVTVPPLSAAADEVPVPPGADRDRPPLVLVIEDNADLAAIARTMLDSEGYRVALAYDGRSGLALARQLQPAIIMLDVLLPQANGWDVLQELKRDPQTVAIPVIVVSILEHQRLGLMLGATDYLVKPLERIQFVSTLQRLVGPAATRPRVLVVDDEPSIREVLSALLEGEGYTVHTADDGVEALEQIATARPGILLLDLMLPRLDGFAVLEWVRAHPDPAIREMPVVLITAKDITPDERQRLTAATEQLISKVGLSLTDLLARVKEILQGIHVANPNHYNPGSSR